MVENEAKKRVLAQTRVSGKGQAHDAKFGIPRQIEAIRAICDRDNLEIVEWYEHVGLSGADVQHDPRFQEILSRLSDPTIAGVVCTSIDRLFRPEFPEDFAILRHFRKNGKLLYCDLGKLDQSEQGARMQIMMYGMMADMERSQIKTRLQGGKALARKQGNRVTDSLPPWVKFVPERDSKGNPQKTGHFEYIPEKAAEVKNAFSVVASGQYESLSQVARELGFGSVTALKATLRSRWALGEKSSLRIRVGRGYRDDGTYSHGHHALRPTPIITTTNLTTAPLIDEDTFWRVQTLLSENHNKWSLNTAHESLAKGIVHCECGAKCYAKWEPVKGIEYGYYICSSHTHKAHGKLGAPRYNMQKADQAIRVRAIMAIQNDDYQKMIEQPTDQSTKAKTDDIKAQIKKLEKKRAGQQALIGDDDANQELVTKLMREFSAQIKLLEAKLAAKPQPTKNIDIRKLGKLFLGFRDLPPTKQRETLCAVFRKITIGMVTAEDDPNEYVDVVGVPVFADGPVLERLIAEAGSPGGRTLGRQSP